MNAQTIALPQVKDQREVRLLRQFNALLWQKVEAMQKILEIEKELSELREQDTNGIIPKQPFRLPSTR